ncbi:hypothetical protein [Rhizobium leguminosarum]|uniref:hypothetical protein n=1 Tax=Rhizobium leguminosarum TaxID=384 RepID=UPI00040D2102|nr:hypothetical protein [Rhizobium leguminosarum]
MKAIALALAIREFAFHAQESRPGDPVLIGDGDWRELPREAPDIGPISDRVSRIVADLDEVLRHDNWRPDRTFEPPADEGHWSIGSTEQRAPIRKIHRGYLEPIRCFSLVEHVPDLVVAFLARIPGWDDYVKREYHQGVGWHYHYLPDPGRRSDVLLAWDTRWQESAPPPTKKPLPLRPFFGEKHGEGKADVQAKPWLWGDKKKESMYGLCAPDLRKWSIHEFRCASSDAEAVWPPGAVVTPMPAPTASPRTKATKPKRRR